MHTKIQMLLIFIAIPVLLSACTSAVSPTPADWAFKTLVAPFTPPAPTSRIDGRLFQSPNSRIPVSNAAITLISIEFDILPAETHTDAQGRYSFPQVIPGMYTLMVSALSMTAEEICSTSSVLQVASNEELKLDLTCVQAAQFISTGDPDIDSFFPTPSEPQFGEIRFASNLEPDAYEGFHPRTIFPIGIREIVGSFDCYVPEEQEFYRIWSKDTARIREEKTVLQPGYRQCQSTLSEPQGLSEGVYELKVYLGGKLLKEGRLEVQWHATIWPVTFAQGLDANDRPITATNLFPIGTTLVYVVLTVENFSTGQVMDYELYYNEQIFLSGSRTWEQTNSAGNWSFPLQSEQGFPPGRYILRLYADGHLEQIANFAVE